MGTITVTNIGVRGGIDGYIRLIRRKVDPNQRRDENINENENENEMGMDDLFPYHK